MEYETKNDIVYRLLKDEIIEGNLKPNERLVIADIAKKYNISAMPVREAMKRLQQDGFVENLTHVGTRVISFNMEELKEIIDVRTELENYATRLATPLIDEPTIHILQDILKEMEIIAKAKDSKRYSVLNKLFHMTIYKAAPNKVLYKQISSLWEKSEISKSVFFLDPNRADISVQEHKEWINAIQEHDTVKSVNLLKRHKEAAYRVLFDAYDNK